MVYISRTSLLTVLVVVCLQRSSRMSAAPENKEGRLCALYFLWHVLSLAHDLGTATVGSFISQEEELYDKKPARCLLL